MSSSWQHRFTQLLNLEWLVYLALLPVVMFVTPARAPILLVLLLFWPLRKWITGHWSLPTPLDWPLRLLAFMVVISLFISFDFAFSFPRVVAVLYGLALIYVVAWTSSRSRPRMWLMIQLFLLMGVGVAGLSLFGTSWNSKIPGLSILINRLPHLISLPGSADGFQANQVAGVLLWVAPLAMALSYTAIIGQGLISGDFLRRHMVRLLLLAVAGLMGLVLLLTQSRGGLMGVGLALVLLVMLACHRRRWLMGLVPVVVALLVLVVVQGLGMERTQDWLFSFRSEGAESSLESLSIRQEIWVRGWFAVQDFPLTGMGMNTFRRVVPVLYPFFALSGVEDISHAHNQLLQTALDVGIPGLIAYVGVWLGAVMMLWRSWRLSGDAWERTWVAGFAAALLGFFIYGLADAVAFGAKPGFLFWYLLGLIAGLHELVVNRQGFARD